MALRIRKDIKKSSYYVWFLGAKESKGIRGKEFILPVIEHLVQREKEIEPFKVTLQVSHKGLKIIQNVLSTNPKTSKPKNETIKHFIPHNTITCVYQDDDVVSCILLLYNPVTKCPLHVHVYRCDSSETASLLKNQLEVLIERPENQKKFTELENRLQKPVEPKKKFDSSIGSDTGTSTRESESSEDRYSNGVGPGGVAALYDSLAAELRQRLRRDAPILLPPRDYDTVHRRRGDLQSAELRRCRTANVVGHTAPAPTPTRRIESSGGSSGIGSDHAPSPESEGGNYLLDNQSTSDEEWNQEQPDSTLYLMQGSDMILPRASRHADPSKFSPEPPKSPTYHSGFQRYPDELGKYQEKTKEISKYQDNPGKRYERYENGREKEYPEREKYHQRHPDDSRKYHEEIPGKYPIKYEENSKYASNKYEETNGRYSDSTKHRSSRYHEDFQEEDYRDKRIVKEEPRRNNSKYNDERYYPEEERISRSRYYQEQEKIRPKYYTEFEDYHQKQKYPQIEDPRHYYQETKTLEKPKKYSQQDYPSRSSKYSEDPTKSSKYQEDFFDDIPESRRRPEDRQRSPTPPEINVSPKDRFKDAKEKFLLLERERINEEDRLRRQDMHHSVPNLKDKTFLKRHDSMAHPKDRFQEDKRFEDGRYQPRPAPRTILEEDRFRREPLERYRSPERYEKNRRSLYNQIEDDHKAKSNEIAKELKRRSYLETTNYDKDFYREDHYREISDKRFPNPEKDNFQFSKSNIELDKLPTTKTQKIKPPAGYRHSYAEPKLSLEKIGKKIYPEMVHRTNSSVSNSGRVGLASVNPY